MSCELRRLTYWKLGMGGNLSSISFKRSEMSSLRPRASCGGLKKSYLRPMTIYAIRLRS